MERKQTVWVQLSLLNPPLLGWTPPLATALAPRLGCWVNCRLVDVH